jgi:transposase
MLAAMAQCLRPGPCQPADLDRERLARLHKRRDQLVAMRQQERTRARDCACPDTSADIARHLACSTARSTPSRPAPTPSSPLPRHSTPPAG